MLSVSIPGKVMLSGEYAVLYGGMAVMLPVPRFLRVTEAKAGGERKYPPAVAAALEEPLPESQGHESQYGLPVIDIDRGEFYSVNPQGQTAKLGLGSSSAEVAGVLALRLQRAGFDWKENREALLKPGLSAHRRAQGGLGSGADVAACTFARPISFARSGSDVHITPLRRPEDGITPPLALYWTGVSVDTRVAVWKFESWVSKGGESVGMLRRLVRLSHRLAQHWFRAGPDDLYAAIDEYVRLTHECAMDAGVDYLTDHLRDLDQWAREHGGRAKPTGAGGGDLALLAGDLPYDELDGLVIRLDADSLWLG